MSAAEDGPYPPIADYGLIGDCHTVALVSRTGSIDWCSLPRIDSAACFGRLMSWDAGGFWRVGPRVETESQRRYLRHTLVLETVFRTEEGEARLTDCFPMREGGRERPYRQILRVVDGLRGCIPFEAVVKPRFDFGGVTPWVRLHAPDLVTAVGGDQGLVMGSDRPLEVGDDDDLVVRFEVSEGERIRQSVRFVPPEELDEPPTGSRELEDADERLERTIEWWQRWGRRGESEDGVERSAIVLKALANPRTGAIAAAATTSLPEATDGSRNWDYRFSWIRDSSFSVESLAELGHESEAAGFRRFIERSAAGHASELQVAYGVGGETRLIEHELPELEGYRGVGPVRLGNAAFRQRQLDTYGELMNLSWRWHQRGHPPDDDYWRFLCAIADRAAEDWRNPDRGIWEVRGSSEHFVHSKVMCWAALHRALALAAETGRDAPTDRWSAARDAIKDAVERDGYDEDRGVFVRVFSSTDLDAALLLLPSVEFVAWDDDRMVRTADAIRDDLGVGGLLRRYRTSDGLEGEEAPFIACSFWLARCLSHQGRRKESREVFDAAVGTANDVGLFSEQYDPESGEMRGNFPQALTHLSHILAAHAVLR